MDNYLRKYIKQKCFLCILSYYQLNNTKLYHTNDEDDVPDPSSIKAVIQVSNALYRTLNIYKYKLSNQYPLHSYQTRRLLIILIKLVKT